MNTQKLLVLGAHALPDHSTVEIVLLRPRHAFAIASLHHHTIEGLGAAEKAYMLDKSTLYFTTHMNKGPGNDVMGLVHHGKLVAQCLILHPDDAHPATGMVDMAPAAAPQALSIMQAVSVKPEYRGLGLMDTMIRHWIAHADSHGRSDLLVEIHVENVASWRNFLQAGLNLVSIGSDPSDGVQVYNAHEKTALAQAKALSPAFNHYAGRPQATCAIDDLPAQKALMRQGYAVTAHDKPGRTLLMTKIFG